MFGWLGKKKHTPGRGETARLVVARGDQDAVRLRLLQKVQHDLERLVVLQHLHDLRGGVVDVAGVVDPAALNHEEEALVAVAGGLLERRQRRRGHLAQAGVHVRHVAAVDLEGHVAGGEQAQQRQRDVLPQRQVVEPLAIVRVRPPVLPLGDAHHVHIVGAAAALGRVPQEMAAAAAEDQVDGPPEHALADLLQGDLVHLQAVVDVGGEAGRGGVGDVGGDDEAGEVAGALGGLEHGAAGAVAGQHADGAVVALAGAREGGRAGGRVGHEAVGRPRARRAPEVLVQRQHVIHRQARHVLPERAGQRERGRAHAVRDHEDEVALARVVAAGLVRRRGEVGRAGRRVAGDRGRRRVAVLEDDGEDDDAGGGDQRPDEEGHLAQSGAGGRSGGRGGAAAVSAVQRGIFLFGAAGRVFGCARRLGEERCPLRPWGLRCCDTLVSN